MTESDNPENAERAIGGVVNLTGPGGNTELVPRGQRKTLPVVGITLEDHVELDSDGQEVTVSVPHLSNPDASLMQCSTCFVQDKCPAFNPGASCSYNIPVRIRSVSQLSSLKDTMMEMQAQRVYMLRFMEQLNGGYADPNLGPEIDRLQRMIKAKESEGKTTIRQVTEISAPGGPGAISRIFGPKASERLADPGPELDADTNDIIEAEIISEET